MGGSIHRCQGLGVFLVRSPSVVQQASSSQPSIRRTPMWTCKWTRRDKLHNADRSAVFSPCPSSCVPFSRVSRCDHYRRSGVFHPLADPLPFPHAVCVLSNQRAAARLHLYQPSTSPSQSVAMPSNLHSPPAGHPTSTDVTTLSPPNPVQHNASITYHDKRLRLPISRARMCPTLLVAMPIASCLDCRHAMRMPSPTT